MGCGTSVVMTPWLSRWRGNKWAKRVANEDTPPVKYISRITLMIRWFLYGWERFKSLSPNVVPNWQNISSLAYVTIIQMAYPCYRINVVVIFGFLCHEIHKLDRGIEAQILSRNHTIAALLDAVSDNWDPSTWLLKESVTPSYGMPYLLWHSYLPSTPRRWEGDCGLPLHLGNVLWQHSQEHPSCIES